MNTITVLRTRGLSKPFFYSLITQYKKPDGFCFYPLNNEKFLLKLIGTLSKVYPCLLLFKSFFRNLHTYGSYFINNNLPYTSPEPFKANVPIQLKEKFMWWATSDVNN